MRRLSFCVLVVVLAAVQAGSAFSAAGEPTVSLVAPRPAVPVGSPVVWRLSQTNATSRPMRRLDVIDVLPYAGDGRVPPTSFHGTRALSGPIPPQPGDVITYTRRDAQAVSVDPDDPTNTPRSRTRSGKTRWCPPKEFGTPDCPRGYGDATAFRIVSERPLASGATVSHTMALTTSGARGGDVFTDRFGARATDESLRARSPDVPVRLTGARIAGFVWRDDNADGVQTPGEPPVPNIPVVVAGRGERYAATTGPDGRYRVGNVPAGAYTVTMRRPATLGWTRYRAGTDRAHDSDVHADGRSDTVTVPDGGEGVVDGGLVRPPKLVIVKTADRTFVKQGGRVRYTIVLRNVGRTPVPNASFTDVLVRALPGARYDGNAKATAGRVAYHRPRLEWRGSLAPGASVTVTYTMTATRNGRPGKLRDSVTAPYSNCPHRPVEDRCEVTVYKLPAGPIKDWKN